MQSRWLTDPTWRETEAWLRDRAVVVVPVTLRDRLAAGDGRGRTRASGDPALAIADKDATVGDAMVRGRVDGLRMCHRDAQGMR